MKIEKINLQEKFTLFKEHWSPKLIAQLNGQAVKIVKVQGDFIWHHHEHEDELFWVMKGTLYIELRDRTLELQQGEMTIIPKGVEHRPYAHEETHILMFEPISTLNTGNVNNDRTREKLEKI